MPKLFIFAIGGTGERVLRSFTMVLASGAPTFDNYEVFPVIIDYDTENADKDRTVKLLQNYAAIHDAAFTRHSASSDLKGQSGQFFAAKLRNLNGLSNYVFPFHPATEQNGDDAHARRAGGASLNTLTKAGSPRLLCFRKATGTVCPTKRKGQEA